MYFLRNHNASPFISHKSDIALEIWAVICTNSFIDFSLSNIWSGSICRAMFSFCLLLNSALSGMRNKSKEIINPSPSSSTASQLESHQLLADSSTKSCDRPSKSRKRKMLAPRTEYVEARHGEEVPPEDGFNWRKYGQKLILGAKYPREYFQCVCRHSDATKMVQRIETESLTFEVTYGESHSCGQENKNQNEELLVALGTQVGRAAGKLSECYIPEMVTPNNS
ncbi:hypothetical protein H5410_028544 [Solanum commersonii]|uniref:WRKY domain-containing protein n=1 Tax=Solanum commersonii TaxID=4109 RepID=A0A9J5Z6G2_SOLCO|nr:hypothetical protein H5410_028544 [Solanum commersonii]